MSQQKTKAEWYLSSPKMTVFAATENLVITEAAPIISKFIGQPIFALKKWMQSHGGELRICKLQTTQSKSNTLLDTGSLDVSSTDI